MKKLCLFIILLVFGITQAQPPYGSYHLIHTQTAKSFEKGRLEAFTNMNFYTKNVQYLGTGDPPNDVEGYNLYSVAGNLAFTYGLSRNFDATIGIRIYQDLNLLSDPEANIPDDIFLQLKAGSLNLLQNRLLGAFQLKFRFPTGDIHNYAYSEYASGGVEYGVGGVLSYYIDPYLPEKSFSIHLNFGWYNHNDTGIEDEYKKEKIKTNTTELQYAFGMIYPTAMFEYILDLYGISYSNDPDPLIRSSESWTYITPGVKYKPLNWLNVKLGVDILISKNVQVQETYNKDMYPPWKAQLGVDMKILPFAPSKKTAAELERDEFNKRVEFFQRLVEERERSEDIREELERLKREREAAEKELEELKQILEEEGK